MEGRISLGHSHQGRSIISFMVHGFLAIWLNLRIWSLIKLGSGIKFNKVSIDKLFLVPRGFNHDVKLISIE
ncbi:hypothetical protein SPLC1_S082270 [Arthrospira platensis C1]|nr:hypothetical protein SPLC1_S082270 [Arthrospira platensis C1]